MRRILIIISIQLSILLSQSIDELFNNGNEFYNEKKYIKALQEYEKILEKDYFSEDLYLNLGNAYFQNSEHGLARWSYEMGLKLNSRNADLINNNNVNKNYIQNYIEVPKNNIIDFINLFFDSFSLNQFFLINSIIIFLSSISFFIKKVFRIKFFDKIYIIFVVSSFILISVTFIKNSWDRNNNFAIIIEDESVIYSAPFLNKAIKQSIFFNGNKVKIVQKTESWIEVYSFDGRKGWIQAQHVRNLN
tara:strand:+ start:2799 stop:3539 length:741 start_codon:yes stop_codon:yes gene_type:complete